MNFCKYKKIRRNVKAISPVISVLLMIAIAVVASLVAYAWVMGFIGNKTEQVGKAIQIQSLAADESGNLAIYVQNVGDSQVQFNSPCVYINGTAATVPTQEPTGSIAPGTTVEFTTNQHISAGTTVTVKVNSADGTFSQVTKTFS
ncbi:MAG: archaellin/type IV pilin N-terminal domain-containing protein [Candidatus Bathyarchaeia archaeon]|jgi:flagellin-like protein